MDNKKDRHGMVRRDVITDEPIDISGLVIKLAQRLAESESVSKKKMSYSISPLAQALIKTIAQETGATQSSIVEIAPLLFAKIAMDSLERRSNALASLKTLHDQVIRSLNAYAGLAPHLTPYTEEIKTIMEELLAMEQAAVTRKNFQGADPSDFPALNRLKPEKAGQPPYNREIGQFLEGNERLAALFAKHQD